MGVTWLQKEQKKWKDHNFLLNGQNPLFQSFPLFGGMIGHIILSLNFLGSFFDENKSYFGYFVPQTLFQALFLEIKP